MRDEDICFVHVTLVPYLRAAEEMKTKPTQQSVAKLREIGIQPNIIVCRTERPMKKELKRKIALFCNVKEEEVIEEQDVKYSIYEVPLVLKEQGMDRLVMNLLRLKGKRIHLEGWEDLIRKIKNRKETIKIAIAGKYTDLKDSYKSIWEALDHAGMYREKNLIEIVELQDHPWFVAVQFHPEFKSRPNKPHPLFNDFIKAAIKIELSK